MPLIHLTSMIHAPVERVFDLARSVSLHKALMRKYRDGKVEGGTNGFMEIGDVIRWSRYYLGRKRTIEVKIRSMETPSAFGSILVRGSMASLRHEHFFKPIQNGTLLIDLLEYTPAFGLLGRWMDRRFIQPQLRKHLEKKNQLIKQYAESDQWKVVISSLHQV